ncbi:hypothetical protein QZH41_004610 [Actinostola sp. cb2023]|nr:hypothetical protein QZH41_004610 [Actinostola sp. cb2023]
MKEEQDRKISENRPKFGHVEEITSSENFLQVIDKERLHVVIVIHLYNKVKFCKIKAELTGISANFINNGLPALLVYKGEQMVGNFVQLENVLGDNFDSSDVESFLIQKPEKGIDYLISHQVLEDNPQVVAKFLISEHGISKQRLGEYMGNIQTDFNMAVLNDSFLEEIVQESSTMNILNREVRYSNSSQDSLADLQPRIITSRQKDNRGLLILHLNVNSLQNKFEEVQSLIQHDFRAQVALLSETKIDSSYPNSQFKIEGYNMYRNDRTKGGGGVLAYFSSRLPSKKLKLPRKFTTIEPLVIESKFGSHDVVVLLIYRPPKASGQDYYLRLEKDLYDIATWASLQKQFLVIAGDLNMDRLRPNYREGKILCDLEDVLGLTCLIDKPTRITESSQTLIDVILTNKPHLFKDSGVYNPEISDHALVYGLMTENAILHPSNIISRSFKNVNEDDLRQDLQSAPWHVAEIFDSVDDQYSYWNDLFNTILHDHAPIKKMKVRVKDVPYMTMEWKHAIRKKRRYAKRYASNPTCENYREKNKWRNLATKLRRKAIKEYWKEKTEDLSNNPRAFYKVFKPFIDTKSQGTDNGVINLEVNGNILKDQTEVANNFANYFATVANDIGDTQTLSLSKEQLKDHTSVHVIKDKTRIVNGPQFEFSQFNVAEVAKVLKAVNPKKSMGHDLIPPQVLKMSSDALAPSLTSIFNACIKINCWPSQWKKGIWVPVFKKDNHLDVKNYRPITLLSAIDKVFEQLISHQISNFMEPRLCKTMTAYRKGHSCETTLIALVEEWKKAVDDKGMVGVLSTDMSKAFDSLHHPLLLSKLEAYGFSSDATSLLQSYFLDRHCKVRITTDSTSDWIEVKRGCPQGSNLGPLLWNVFQNDLSFSVNKGKLMMYADDHQLYTTGKNVNEVQSTLNEEGKSISGWYQTNQLQGNLTKYQVLNIGPKQQDKVLDVTMMNTCIKQDKVMKLLGVSIDENLDFSHHMFSEQYLYCNPTEDKAAQDKVLILAFAIVMLNTDLHSPNVKKKMTEADFIRNLEGIQHNWHFTISPNKLKLPRKHAQYDNTKPIF